MLRSMTGFGAAASEDGAVSVELRAVNHRHLQAKIRLPHEFSGLEAQIDRLIKKRLERGAVSCAIHRARSVSDASPSIDHEAAGRAHTELAQLAATLNVDPPTLKDVLAVPGVIAHREEAADDTANERVLPLVEDALTALVAMRETEGAALLADLSLHIERLRKVTQDVAERAPKLVTLHQEALTARVEELLSNSGQKADLKPSDLAREVALLADKLDISEELSRLASHLSQFDDLLDQGGGIGRKLEFLIQELLREVNTIGSKANDAQIAQWIVEAKTHVERLREQAANVE